MKLIKKLENSNVRFIDLLKYVYSKAFWTFFRGMLWSIFVKCKYPFFVGRAVKINHCNYLSVGRNVYIGDYSAFYCLGRGGVNIGDNVTIREFAWLQLTSSLSNPGESINIGSDTYIGPRSSLGAAGKLSIGKCCQIGSGVSFVAENHQFSNNKSIFEQGVSRKGIVIEDDCWIGNNVIILDGVTIGTGAVIGAGAVVTKSFGPGSVIVGNPARIMKVRSSDC